MQQCGCFRCRHSLGKEESLKLVTFVSIETVSLLGRLDSFGQYRHTQLVPERDNGVANACCATIGADVPNEALVDLQLVDRKPPKMVETRITRAKIVERQRDAQSFE